MSSSENKPSVAHLMVHERPHHVSPSWLPLLLGTVLSHCIQGFSQPTHFFFLSLTSLNLNVVTGSVDSTHAQLQYARHFNLILVPV